MTLAGIMAGLKKPSKIFIMLGARGYWNWISDSVYLKIIYRLMVKKHLNLEAPSTFNEKMQWLKIYDRKPEYTRMVDKFEAKEYVAERIGTEHIVPSFGVWDSFDEIDFDMLPNQFVLKTTHDCGGVIICKDKASFDKKAAKRKIKKSMKRNYSYLYREWPYKNVKPRILAEKYIESLGQAALPVYKVFNFSGEPRIIQAIQNDKLPDESIDYFDVEWNKLDLCQNYPNSRKPFGRPKQLEQMLILARQLSKGHVFLRTDFYIVDDKIWFSENTFYSDAGLAQFSPESWDLTLGKWLDITELMT